MSVFLIITYRTHILIHDRSDENMVISVERWVGCGAFAGQSGEYYIGKIRRHLQNITLTILGLLSGE